MVMVLPLAAYAASEVSLENASITMGTNSTDSQSSVGDAWFWGLLKDGIISERIRVGHNRYGRGEDRKVFFGSGL